MVLQRFFVIVELLQNNHPPHRVKLSCLQSVEIDAACYPFAAVIPTVPVGRFGFDDVVACLFVAQTQFPDKLPLDVVDGNSHRSVFWQLVGYPGVRVEWVREVLQQTELFWNCFRDDYFDDIGFAFFAGDVNVFEVVEVGLFRFHVFVDVFVIFRHCRTPLTKPILV